MKTTDGTTWIDTGFSTFTGAALSSIYAVSSTKAYAVGPIGSVAKLDGTFWTDISSSIPAAYQSYNFTGVSVATKTHPLVDTTVIAGTTARFTAAASGTPAPTVKWQVKTSSAHFRNL